MLTCVIRYHIDPTKRAEFEHYARNWGQAIPRCGADLTGYFAPHEGSSTLAYGIYNVRSLADYEAYRARLAEDPLGKENYAFAQDERFLLREDRTFVKLVSGAPRHEGLCMIVVIFEVEPAEGKRQAYLDLAADLRSHLREIDGFISVERFQSLTDPGKLLSLSFFRDEEAVQAWRTLAVHRKAQAAGRGGIFAGYRLRVADVVRDYGLADRSAAPPDSCAVHG